VTNTREGINNFISAAVGMDKNNIIIQRPSFGDEDKFILITRLAACMRVLRVAWGVVELP
jgi:hypothetical protein